MATASNTGRGRTPMRSALGRARGLGAAKGGVHHWWAERVSAVALVPLSVWFVASVVAMAGADYDRMTEWLSNPIVAVLMILTVVATFYHAALGMQVVYEDYIHHDAIRIAVDLGTKFACIALGALAVFAVLKVALGA